MVGVEGVQVNDKALFPARTFGNRVSEFAGQKRGSIETNLTRKGRQLTILEQLLQFLPANNRSVFVADGGRFGREVRTKTRTSIFSFEVSGHGNCYHPNTNPSEKKPLIFPMAVIEATVRRRSGSVFTVFGHPRLLVARVTTVLIIAPLPGHDSDKSGIKPMAARTFDEQEVRRVLRHRESKSYFRNGGWTDNAEEADCFEDVEQAAETCLRYGLSGVEVALRLEAASCDLFCTAIR